MISQKEKESRRFHRQKSGQESYGKTNNKYFVFLIFVASAFFLSLFLISKFVNAQYNYDHVNVTTQVNVTNAGPEILQIAIDSVNGNITLNAGGAKTINCNATIRDWNGFNDIDVVEATFYHYLNLSSDDDDLNEHYTNTSCAETSNDGQFMANYTCSFDVYYFANNGTWYCNMTVNDTYGYGNSNNASANILPLYALNVTSVIDYGNLSVLDTSDNITATITNFGNRDVNVSVLGYGLTVGDGVGLVCSQGSNISVENQRFSTGLVDWNDKIQLSASGQLLNETLLHQQDDNTPVIQNTYWQLFVPPNPFGECVGTVRFTASIP